MHTQHDSTAPAIAAPAIVLTRKRQPAYSLPRGVNADSPPSSRRLASKFCFYPSFTE